MGVQPKDEPMGDAFNADDWYSDETATFGDRLAAAREAADLSQKNLAERVGVKLSTLRSWEDDLSEPRANRLSMLAGILGVSLSWMLNGEGEGVLAPDEEEGRADLAALLLELRSVRVQLAQSNDRLAHLEKRLRAVS